MIVWFCLEQRFHELAREYAPVQDELVKQREIESQLRTENEQLSSSKVFHGICRFIAFFLEQVSEEIEQQLTAIRQSEQLLTTKLVCDRWI